MQTQNRLFDEFAKFLTNAAGAARGMREEAETMFRTQMERIAGQMDFVKREEFDAVKAMAAKARAQVDALEARIATLEARVGGGRVVRAPIAANRPRRSPRKLKRR
ncbi:MAG: accessory factor UbiK family protein [Alphaproteobacteria bacterium]|nr:accessory factor UbiK family protein [Alphaproteobacteria bacterium]